MKNYITATNIQKKSNIMDPLFSTLVYSIGVLDLIDVLGYFVAHARGDKLEPPAGLDALKNRISNKAPEDGSTQRTDDLNKEDFRTNDLGTDQVNELQPKVDELPEQLVVDPQKDDHERITTISSDDVPKQKVEQDDSSSAGKEGAKTENQTQVFIETERAANENDSLQMMDESKLRPISRDDELRHHRVKRSSVSSVSSHGSRKEELEALSSLEAEEQGDDNFTPIMYSGADYPLDFPEDVDVLETIPEAGSSSNDSADFTDSTVRETSPKPNVPAEMSLPWGDLKAGPHPRDSWVKDKSLSIDEAVEEDEHTPKGETILVQKKINLIGIKPTRKDVDLNNNEVRQC